MYEYVMEEFEKSYICNKLIDKPIFAHKPK